MAFTTSSQETEWALFLQPFSLHGALVMELIEYKALRTFVCESKASAKFEKLHRLSLHKYCRIDNVSVCIPQN